MKHKFYKTLSYFRSNSNYFKVIIVFSLLILACSLTYYFYHNMGTEVLVSHSFYPAIILASFWWRKKGILVAVFISFYLILCSTLLLNHADLTNNILRGALFILVSYIISNLADSMDKVRQRYKLLFDHMESAVSYNKIIKDQDGNIIDFEILDVNTHFEKVFSLKKKSVIGKSFTLFFPEIKEPEYNWLFRFKEVIFEEKTISFEHYFHPLDLWLYVEVFPTEKDFFVIIFRDITPNVIAAKEHENIQKQIQHSERLASIGLLAAGVGHEINNPLTIIQLNLDDMKDYLAEKDIKDTFITEKFNKQNEAIVRISKIVEGLKIYARQDLYTIEDVDVQSLLNSTISLIETIYKKEDIRINKVFNSTNPIIRGNKGKLQQVFMNLFSNARDTLVNKSGGEINITTKNVKGSIVIDVSDTGEGIPNNQLKRIFDTFYTTKPPGKGTGLGLSILHSIVTDLNGTIKVESVLGEGTKFTITLPTVFEIPIKKNAHLQTGESQNLQGRILIVDDEEDLINIMKGYLILVGLEVDTATNGIEGLEYLKENKYKYFITDLKMPGMNGDILIKNARELHLLDDTKTFIMSGGYLNEYSEEERNLLTNDIDFFIQKPFTRESLYKILKKFDY